MTAIANAVQALANSQYQHWHEMFRRETIGDWVHVSFVLPDLDVGTKEAREKGRKFLIENLNAKQRADYEKHKRFDVTGGESGKTYRIKHGRRMNIAELDKKGRRVCGWCFLPQGDLVAGDVMLAQKVALELHEGEALKIAHRFP